MTLSLAALDYASALKQKEWSRGEPGEDIPQMYSTIGGCLTPTAPVYGDIRTDPTLNVTPEESLGDLPAAVGGIDERESTQQTIDEERDPPSTVAPPAAEVPETSPKVINERSVQEDSPRRNEITRETSRDDSIAATRHFSTMVNEQRHTTNLPAVTTTGVSQVNIPPVSHYPIETEPTEPGTTCPQTYLPNGSPLDPLLQLLVDLKHGYNVYQKDKLRSIPERMRTH